MTGFLQSLFSLEGKTALVTGGAKGIGRMITDHLLQAGCRVIISSRSEGDCNKTAEELSVHGSCLAMPADLSSLDSISELTAKISDSGTGLHILVNNSGKSWGAPIEEFPEKGWDSVMDLNVKTPFYLVQKLLPQLTASATAEDPGRVINIGSIAGLSAESLSAYSYGASKAAIQHLTKTLAKDLARRHVTVNAIAPGFFPTNMTDFIVQNEALMSQALKGIPLQRVGKPGDIGALVIFLASPAASFMTGAVLPLDGGQVLGG